MYHLKPGDIFWNLLDSEKFKHVHLFLTNVKKHLSLCVFFIQSKNDNDQVDYPAKVYQFQDKLETTN